MAALMSREVRLKSRPVGLPKVENFEVAEVAMPSLQDGEILVRNTYMSVDPYMRGRMYDRASYVPPFEIGEPLDGGCVGQVIETAGETAYQAGDYVSGRQGWREYYVSDGSGLTKVDPSLVPLQAYLGTVGMPGMTAYIGLLDIGQPKEGDTVFVSAAAGAVGSIVCQIAKIKGCRVVGSAGSEAKVAWLRDVAGVDATFNYKAVSSLINELGRHCPDGIDVYFENVGGDHLEAALEHMNPFGRIALCGMISQYNDPQPGPSNLSHAVRKRLMMQGFIVSDHMDRLPQFHQDMQSWIGAGQIRWEETVVDGIDNAPSAFIGLFTGENMGKMLVRLNPEASG